MFNREGGLAPRLRDTSAYPDYSRQHFPVSEDLAATTIWFKTQALMGSRGRPKRAGRHREDPPPHGRSRGARAV